MRATAVSTIGRRPKCKSKHPSVREGSERCHGSGETQSDRDAIVARGVMVVLMLFVSSCRASEFCVNSHFHLVLHDRYSDKTQCSSRENPDGRPRSWRDAPWSVHTCAQSQTRHETRTHRHTSVVTIVETHEDSRDERMCRMSAESRFARRARSLRSGVTPLTGSARFRRFYHTRPNAQSDADCRARVRLH